MTKAKNRKAKQASRKGVPSTVQKQRWMALQIAHRGLKSGRPVRPSQTAREGETVAVAMEARRRLYGLTEQQAKDARAGYPVGFLELAGVIGQRHVDAAYAYALADSCWRTLKGLPRQTLPAVILHGSRGRSNKPDPEPRDLEEAIANRDAKRARVATALTPYWHAVFDRIVLQDEQSADPLVSLCVKNGLDALV